MKYTLTTNYSPRGSFKSAPDTQKFIITIGLPGSGKTTFAENLIEEYGYTVIIHECPARTSGIIQESINHLYNSNRDDLRFEIYNKYKISAKQEKQITIEQEKRINEAIKNGQHIIISDTNLNPKTQEKWKQLAIDNNLELEIKDFTHIPLDICIKQDLQREKSVGKDVIMNMYIRYIRPKLYKHNSNKQNKPNAVIFDIDGTLAIMNGRSAYDWDKVDQDLPKKEIIDIATMYADSGYEILFCSGRMDCCRDRTIKWLDNNFQKYTSAHIDNNLFMRKTDDMRPDYEVKKELFINNIDKKYNVKYVFDDRESVVRLWRDLGITCLQVDDGLF